MSRTTLLVAPAAALFSAVLALIVALQLGGAAQQLAAADPGVLVRIGAPAAQLAVDIAAALTLGPLLLAALALSPAESDWGRTLDLAAAAAGAWTVAALASGLFDYLDGFPRSFADPQFGPGLIAFLTTPGVGGSWLAMALITAVLTVLCVAVRSQTGVALLVLTSVVALVPMAQQGHAATADADHDAAISSLGLHIVSAAGWIGGLVALLLLARSRSGDALARLVERYSSVALVCFIVVAVSGVVNAAIRLGSPAALLTPYGLLVVVKALALLGAGAFGAAYRLAVIPRLRTAGSRQFLSLVGVELAVLGVASGFAAALSRTPTPIGARDLSDPTPAEVLTQGRSLPPAPSAMNYLTQWRPDLIWLLAIGFLAVWYLAGVRRLARRGDRWPLHRTVVWLLGLAVLLLLTNGGLSTYEDFLFSSHMLMHMGLTMVVPLLLVPAAPVTLAMRAIQRRTDGTRGPREWLLLLVHSRIAGVLGHPVVAGALFAGSLIVFYYSALFRWATTDHIGHEWMTVHFVITGYLFVQSLVGVDPQPHRVSYPLRLLVLLAVMAFHAFFGLSLLNGQGLLLADWFGAMGWGTDALEDQRIGGAIAWSVGEIPTVALAVAVAVQWSRTDERESRRRDRHADRTGDADLAAYNDMLAGLGRSRA